jgi:hypothetical protein
MESAIWWVLGGAIYPLWLGSGALDYACHRRDRIEALTGTTEPLLHLAQALQLGAAALLALFFETSLAVLCLSAAAVAVHTATAYADLRYAASRREVGVAEQFAHAFLIALPLAALSLLVLLHVVEGRPGGLALRSPGLPAAALAAVSVSGLLVAVLPAWWEVRRARRAG